MPHNSHGLILYTCSTNFEVLLNNWHTLKTAARVTVIFLFLYFILSYEFKITNSVKVQCRNRGHQIDSNGEKSRALALIPSDVTDRPSLFSRSHPRSTRLRVIPSYCSALHSCVNSIVYRSKLVPCLRIASLHRIPKGKTNISNTIQAQQFN
jgi:hypothetical protein